tara:strand:- start:200 stop:400 length:201 start_codon:yes stop_codon:yes gene_type:complete
MERAGFVKKTKNIIALRTGYKCSFSGCNKTLIESGETSNDYMHIAEFAHIFSATAKDLGTSGGPAK